MPEETEETKDSTAQAGQDQEAEAPHEDPSAQRQAAEAAEDVSQDFPLPKIDFATFIFSLNSSGLVHLGMIEDPATGQKDKNLSMAKQTIDILGMLEEKTRGNLNKDEESMLQHILYDLRILYVKEKR